MQISSVKTEIYSLSRFFKDLESFVLEDEKDKLSLFEMRGDFYIGYVNPADLSFHNFENILDINGKFPSVNFTPLEIIGDRIYKTKLDSSTVRQLLEYNKLNLYIEPQNSDSRGGKRFIFADRELADCISQSLKLSTIDYIVERKNLKDRITGFEKRKETNEEKLYNDRIIEEMKSSDATIREFENFSRCNTVFRYNRFDVGDADFKSHYDTPYVDREQNELSKYTILIYLTRCHNSSGLLNFGSIIIRDIYPGDVYIFDQQILHSGSSPVATEATTTSEDSKCWIEPKSEIEIQIEEENKLLDSYLSLKLDKNPQMVDILHEKSRELPPVDTKIFIRSELIFNELSAYEYDEHVASLFNKACYFSRESIQLSETAESRDEIKRYSSHLFNSTMKARMRLFNHSEDTNRLYLCKYNSKYEKTIKFITDGNHCYFLSGKDYKESSLPIFATIVINNYFSSNLIEKKRIYLDDISEIGILKFLNNLDMEDDFFDHLKDPKLECIEYEDPFGDKATYEYKSHCNFGRDECRGCVMVEKLCDAVNIEREKLKKEISKFNVTSSHGGYFADNFYVDSENTIIDPGPSGKIRFPNIMFPQSINFASCQCDQVTIEGDVYVKQKKIDAYIVPPIDFKCIEYTIGGNKNVGYRLTLDIFKNGFIYSKKMTVNQPFTVERDWGDEGLHKYEFPDDYVQKSERGDEGDSDNYYY